jgi:hypothetical protein
MPSARCPQCLSLKFVSPGPFAQSFVSSKRQKHLFLIAHTLYSEQLLGNSDPTLLSVHAGYNCCSLHQPLPAFTKRNSLKHLRSFYITFDVTISLDSASQPRIRGKKSALGPSCLCRHIAYCNRYKIRLDYIWLPMSR